MALEEDRARQTEEAPVQCKETRKAVTEMTEDERAKAAAAVSDSGPVMADEPIPWPSTSDGKSDALKRLMHTEPSAAQAEVLRRALALEEEGWLVPELMRALARHQGKWDWEVLIRNYEDALAS